MVDQELLARIEYLAAENRILKAQLKGRLKLSDAERATPDPSLAGEDRCQAGASCDVQKIPCSLLITPFEQRSARLSNAGL
jgi:hypothetical protein